MPEEKVDPSIYVDHEGERIYFCCKRCRRNFQKDPQAYLPDSPAQPETRSLIGYLGKFHPAAVHFPVALILAAALAEWFRLRSGRESYLAAARWCLWGGALGSVVAVSLGYAAQATVSYPGMEEYLDQHQWGGTVGGLLAVVALIALEKSRHVEGFLWGRLYRGALFLGAAVILWSAFRGGQLVHGVDHYAW